ncbi:MAG: hypothetical protein ACI8O8_003096 [Oleiphilaceae bacterium]|jgi:hypothetical protein
MLSFSPALNKLCALFWNFGSSTTVWIECSVIQWITGRQGVIFGANVASHVCSELDLFCGHFAKTNTACGSLVDWPC